MEVDLRVFPYAQSDQYIVRDCLVHMNSDSDSVDLHTLALLYLRSGSG
jgi:hypothetical protein